MQQARPLLALSLRALSIALVSTAFMLGKLAAETGVHLLEVVFWRQASAFPVLLCYFVMSGKLHRVRTQRLGAHVWRSVLGTMAMLLSFGAAILLPLAEATTLGFTGPIFAVILGALLYGQRAGPWRILAVVVGFAGIVVIARPSGNTLPLSGALVGLGGGLGVALVSHQLRDLGRTETPLAIVFWFSAITSPALALAMPFVMVEHDWHQIALLAAIGISGSVAQFLMAAALRFGQVSSVIIMDYTALFWSIVFGWLIWHQIPAASTWLGAPLIILAGLIVVFRELWSGKMRVTAALP